MKHLSSKTLKNALLIAGSIGLVSIGTAVLRPQGFGPRWRQFLAKDAIATAPITSPEQSILPIEITGPLANRDSEVSSLAWYAEYLILLPQYPETLGNNIFALPKADIVAAIASENAAPLEPIAIPFNAPDFAEQIDGYEGFEAIAFRGNQAYMTIEVETRDAAKGYVLTGTIDSDLTEFVVDPTQQVESLALATSPNKADEAILLTEDQIVSIYEVSGQRLTPEPEMHTFDYSLAPRPSIPFPNIEYRITDATELDENNRFWVINYFFSGDRDLLPERDPLTIRYGRGETHRQYQSVERLIE
ncbi:MAG: hypothetical protein AAFQ63_22030, partial [Cyanobacteria bacterium J06621_11]